MGNRSSLVSIIIPFYNASKTLPTCLASIRELEYPSLELIFVDDCSKDSGTLLVQTFIDEWINGSAKTAYLIKHASNSGVASARNTGLDQATGDYIYYVDADDELDKKTIALAVEAAEQTHADIVGFNWFLAFDTNKRKMPQPTFTSSKEALEMMMCGTMRWNLWLFLVKRSLYEENQIRFLHGMNMGEDMLAMIKLFASAKNVLHVDQYLYTYRQSNNQSLTKTYAATHVKQVTHNVESAIAYLNHSSINLDLSKYAAFLKLNIKLPLLISNKTSQYRQWKTWFPEANEYAGKNPHVSWRTRLLERCAFTENFWAIQLYYYCIIRVVYGIIYK